MAQVNPDATLIPDGADVWIALKSDVADISTMIPSAVTTDDAVDFPILEGLGWELVGLIDDKKGIPFDPSIEVTEYDAFGHPVFRVKAKKGKLKSGFTTLEDNAVTRKIVLPGSDSNHIGAPRDTQIYVLYRFVDEDRARALVSMRPALAEVKGKVGIVDGELDNTEVVIHHSANAAGDVFRKIGYGITVKTFTIGAGVTAYTATVNAQTTASIATKTAGALESALKALALVGSSGVSVSGPSGGPLVATFTVPAVGVSASGTGGTVTVS